MITAYWMTDDKHVQWITICTAACVPTQSLVVNIQNKRVTSYTKAFCKWIQRIEHMFPLSFPLVPIPFIGCPSLSSGAHPFHRVLTPFIRYPSLSSGAHPFHQVPTPFIRCSPLSSGTHPFHQVPIPFIRCPSLSSGAHPFHQVPIPFIRCPSLSSGPHPFHQVPSLPTSALSIPQVSLSQTHTTAHTLHSNACEGGSNEMELNDVMPLLFPHVTLPYIQTHLPLHTR